MSTVPVPEPQHQARFIRVGDVAALMNIPASTVYELVRQQRIGGVVRVGRHVRFERDKLERWLKDGGEKEAV